MRQLVERIGTDVRFQWFLDMNLDDALFDASVFSKNQAPFSWAINGARPLLENTIW